MTNAEYYDIPTTSTYVTRVTKSSSHSQSCGDISSTPSYSSPIYNGNEKTCLLGKKSYSYYNNPIVDHDHGDDGDDEDDGKKDFSSLDDDLFINDKNLTINSIKSMLLNCPASGLEERKKRKNKKWVIMFCQSFIIILLLIFLLKSHLSQIFGSSDDGEYEKKLIIDEEEARQFIRNNGGHVEDTSFKNKVYSKLYFYL
uniref:Cation_ATPase_N domain-containing protein n=1 Tax=Strongyloides papillosus TaxID=174720 RepID=A0A0N5C3D6_STREA